MVGGIGGGRDYGVVCIGGDCVLVCGFVGVLLGVVVVDRVGVDGCGFFG